MNPAVRQVLFGVGNTSAALFKKLTDPNKPMPAFVEGWASNTFHGQDVGLPTGFASAAADSEGVKIYSVNVTGASGATSLTGTFDTVIGAGTWGCSILHDDGTYGIYTASGITAGTITISPGLRAAATAKPLAALGGVLADQHYGLQGYKALARRIFAVTNQDGYRNRYASKFTTATDTSGLNSLNGALTPAWRDNANPFTNTGAGSYFRSRGNRTAVVGCDGVIGRGVTQTVDLRGGSGYLEAFLGLSAGPSFNVKVVVDGVTLHNTTYTAFTRVQVPYSNASSGTIEISGATTTSTNIRLGDVTWWSYDRSGVTWTDRVIGVNDKVVLLGDSWSARYSGGMGIELAQAMTDAGGTTGSVTTVALGGMEAEWGLDQFESRVATVRPQVVVIEFFTNDRNAYTAAGYERWLKAMYRIGLKCQSIGARPMYVMPLPTISPSQSTDHGIWAELLGAGRTI